MTTAPRLRAHAIATDEPARATTGMATQMLHDVPRRRPLLIAVARLGAHPGLRPSPWVLDGLADALGELDLRGEAIQIGSELVRGLDPIATRLGARGIEPASDDRRPLAVRPAGSRRGLRIPRAWIGRALCLVVPGVHVHHRPSTPTGLARGSVWHGPVGQALGALAQHWGATHTRDPVELATRCLCDAFSHVSVIIDGSWWAPLSSEDASAPELLSPERVLGLHLDAPISTAGALDPHTIDTWLGRQLGLPIRPPRTVATAAPTVIGTAADQPWPQRPSRPSKRPGLAGQALDALWQRADRQVRARLQRGRPVRAALPPAVPGPLAALWDAHERSARPA